MMRPGPPMSVPSTNARRRIVTEMPNCSASPAQTPATILPWRERYHVRVSGLPASRKLPQWRHLTASARISSAQYGQRLLATSGTALLAPQTHLPLGDDRDHPVGQREQERERRGVVEDDVEAERARQQGVEHAVHRPHEVEIEEDDQR